MQVAAIPERAPCDAKFRAIAGDGDRIGRISLQFDGINPSLFRSLDDADRLVKILIVVRRQFCNHVYRVPRTNGSVSNFHLSSSLVLHCSYASHYSLARTDLDAM